MNCPHCNANMPVHAGQGKAVCPNGHGVIEVANAPAVTATKAQVVQIMAQHTALHKSNK